jgi:hypothetical protein
MIEAELRMRAVLRSLVVELTRTVEVPFPPPAWMVLLDGPDVPEPQGHRVAETFFDLAERKYVCRLLDDLDAAARPDLRKSIRTAAGAAAGWTRGRGGGIAAPQTPGAAAMPRPRGRMPTGEC